ncbi:MAG: NlpC/P60 family protein [Micromonosporaceae bacterium]
MGMAHRRIRRTMVAGIAALVIGFTSFGVLGVTQAEAETSYGGKITRDEVMKRAKTWLGKVWYSQTNCYKRGKPPCKAPSYRTDCSGYVSMAWKLPFSRYTGNLREVTHKIARSRLKRGDILFRRDGSVQHVALFVRWAGGGRPVVWEEYSSGHTAEQRTWSKSWASTYTAYRYDKIVDSKPKPKPTKPKPKPTKSKPKPTSTQPKPTSTRPKPTASASPSQSPSESPSESPSASTAPPGDTPPPPTESPVEQPTPEPTSTEPQLPETGTGPVALLGGFGGGMLLLGTGLLWWAARQRYRGLRRHPI